MRFAFVLSLALEAACAPSSPPANPAIVVQHLDSLAQHVDRLTLSLDALSAKIQPAQSQKRVVCRARKLMPVDDRQPGDIEAGPVEKCPPPNDDGPCLHGVPASTYEARCEAGKLKP